MARKKRVKKHNTTFLESIGIGFFKNERTQFTIGFFLFVVALILIIAFSSYFFTAEADQSILLSMKEGDISNTDNSFQNICGSLGAVVSNFLIADCFGIAAFGIPLIIIIVGLKLTRAYKSINLLKWFFSIALIMIWCSVAFAKFLTPLFSGSVYNPGGNHGLFCVQRVENLVGAPGLIALLVIVALAYLTYLSATTVYYVRNILNPSRLFANVKFSITNNKETSSESTDEMKTEKEDEVAIATVYDDPAAQTVEFTSDGGMTVTEPAYKEEDFGKIRRPRNNGQSSGGNSVGMSIETGEDEKRANGNTVENSDPLSTPINPKEPFTRYKYPTLDLLKRYENDGKPYIDEKEQMANKDQIVKVLGSFGVQIKEIRATVGPTITLYEITPAEGVRISRIRSLEDDIALSLKALGVRIIAPIPGKGTIGIEVPNAKPNIVSMRSILDSKKFQESKMDLPIALGKTITNEVYMVDLAKIPHLLVAGATGQGKSVGLNAIITSLLYKKHPNELKLVLIDPKKVEFSVYTPIADHFMATVDDDEEPIITDVTKVVRTLKSLCTLMDHRYDMLKQVRARNIKEYNKKYINHELNLTEGHEYMPYIVVIIDEFGDLILTAGKEIELPIARIAQLARAVGIHMVIATQRPTTSIITGNIKANFPGRMAFKVSAMIDSRTILDRPGANQLVGRGDMLILNGGDPERVQCAFIDTPEVEAVNEYISKQSGPTSPMELPEPVVESTGSTEEFGPEPTGLDPMFVQAARAIVATQQGSTSMIQRRFSIGYNRAGRLMDQLEKAGIVGAAQGSKPREVLIADENSLNAHLQQMS